MPSWEHCGIPVRESVALAPLTSWGIGGPARWFAEPETVSQLATLLARAERDRVRTYILGGGSNLLIGDRGVDGLVVRLRGETMRQIVVDEEKGIVELGAGASLASAVGLAMEHGLGGLDALAGIPGTVGGAVKMNAGTKTRWIGHYVESLSAVDGAGRFVKLGRHELFFRYRESSLERLVVTDVRLRLPRAPEARIRARFEKMLAAKRSTQPLSARSAGCVFKNPKGFSAGELIDRAGCKGLREGGAVVSELHANFFLNEGAATFRDMRRLIERVRQAVKQTHGADLELEVALWW